MNSFDTNAKFIFSQTKMQKNMQFFDKNAQFIKFFDKNEKNQKL